MTTLSMTLMAKSPLKKETRTPTITGPHSEPDTPASIPSGSSRMREPRMVGMEIRKTNFTANSLSSLQRSEAKSVEPDQDIPGMMAIPCTIPTKIEFLKFRFVIVLSPPP